MIAVVLAGARRMIRMRMIPSDDFQALLAGCFFGVKHVLTGHREPIVRRIITTIYQRMKCMNLATDSPISNFRVSAKKSAATFVRIGLRSVGATLASSFGIIFHWGLVGHETYSSPKNRSLKFLAGKAANPVTI